jgi:capsular exopolysaccharide synthesis family protein
MELKQYMDILWRRKWMILFTVIAIMAAVGVYTRKQTPMYRSSTVIRIAASNSGGLSYSDYVYATQLMNTYVEIATSRPILDELKEQLDLNYLPAITAEVIPNTELVKITAESANPALAANAANALTDILISESRELYSGGGKSSQEILGEQLVKAQTELDQTRDAYARLIIKTPAPTGEIETTRQLLQLNQNTYTTLLGQFTQAALREEIRSSMITVIEPALVPQIPFEPRASLNYVLGFVVGLMGGLGLAFVFESQDTSLYTSEEIESVVGLSALAKIPKANKSQLRTYQEDFSPLMDAFQNLALNLQPARDQSSKKVFLIMSAEPGQGKSMIVHRLALSLAELEKKVVVIDCDVRLPRLHTLFSLSNDVGLTDVLEQKVSLHDALQASSFEDIKLLASGMPLSHPPKLLGSHQMVNLLDGLKREFDYVLLDTSALLAASDITAIVPNVDSVLLVVRRGHAHHDALHSIKKVLAGLRYRDKPVSLIVNQAEDNKGYSRYRYRKILMQE